MISVSEMQEDHAASMRPKYVPIEYQLVQDGGGYWYVIDRKDMEEFDYWLEYGREYGYDGLTFDDKRVECPESVTFHHFKVDDSPYSG